MPTSSTPGTITTYSTIYSIGVEWDIGSTDDTNNNATTIVRYRISPSGTWKNALNLVRVKFGGRNMLAGSVLFLEPGTAYDIELTFNDPDGGADVQTRTVSTRALPAKPTGGNTYHVIPGSGGGNGSAGNPFQGLAAAQTAAAAKDTLLLHAGNYGAFSFTKSGNAGGDYIVWRDAGDGEVTFGAIAVSASNLWFEGLTVRNQATGMIASGSSTNNVVSRCSFQNNHKAISLNSTATYWYIADNTIVGDNDPLGGSFSGEGVDMQVSDGHTVTHNSISRVADGISYPRDNVDIFGNDIFDTSDDGVETDNGRVNVRAWKNRIHFSLHNGLTFQDQTGAPWYYIRNQVIIDTGEGIFKFVTVDRFLAFHNTFINTQPLKFNRFAEGQLKAYSRNNLYIATGSGGSQIWDHRSGVVDWRTNLDYDGFDWGTFVTPFRYNGVDHATLISYSTAIGQESNAIQVNAADIFRIGKYTKRATETHLPSPYLDLKTGATAIDAGVPLNNINEDYFGNAPDLGAYEFGAPLPIYGPRDVTGAITAGPTPLDTAGVAPTMDLGILTRTP